MSARNLKLWRNGSLIFEQFFNGSRFYSTSVDLKKLRPMILKRIEERAKEYPLRGMLPVAHQVLHARNALYDGVSILSHHVPISACKYCPEVFIGESGHFIRTCHGYRHLGKNKVHNWVKGNTNDVIVPVETFHLQKMFHGVIKHHERFDHERIPAVLELCLQAGVDPNHPAVSSSFSTPDNQRNNDSCEKPLSENDLRMVATRTLKAWESLRSGVGKLLLVYPARVCKHCSEVHVGPSGHKARMCGVFKYERWRGAHFWEKAKVDDLVPPKVGWFRRRQDPAVLVDEGRNYYGRAPAVVDLCSKAGALVPSKYFCMMKMDGLTAPVGDVDSRVREAAMDALERGTYILCKRDSINDGNESGPYFDANLANNLVGGLVKQAVEKMDKIRESAARILLRILYNKTRFVPHILHREILEDIVPDEADLKWGIRKSAAEQVYLVLLNGGLMSEDKLGVAIEIIGETSCWEDDVEEAKNRRLQLCQMANIETAQIVNATSGKVEEQRRVSADENASHSSLLGSAGF